jgi:hypothetical protein
MDTRTFFMFFFSLFSDLGSSPGQQRRRISGETRLDRLVRKPSGESRTNGSLQRPAAAAPSKSSSFDASSPMPPALPKPRKVGGGRSSAGAANASREEEPFYDLVANEEVAAFEEEDEYDNHLLYEVKGKKKEGVRTLGDVSKTSRVPVQPPEAPARSAGKSSALFGSLSRTGSEALSRGDELCEHPVLSPPHATLGWRRRWIDRSTGLDRSL